MSLRSLAALILAAAAAAWGGPAGAGEVRVGYTVSVDLPWITQEESQVKGGPDVRRAQSYIGAFWSKKYGRILGLLAIIPRPMTYFTGDSMSLDEEITNWSYFKDKKITDKHGIACVYGSCLAFKADDAACAVFRRQIGTAGKARVDSYSESAGPRLYGYYCTYATPTLDSREMDEVLQGIKG